MSVVRATAADGCGEQEELAAYWRARRLLLSTETWSETGSGVRHLLDFVAQVEKWYPALSGCRSAADYAARSKEEVESQRAYLGQPPAFQALRSIPSFRGGVVSIALVEFAMRKRYPVGAILADSRTPGYPVVICAAQPQRMLIYLPRQPRQRNDPSPYSYMGGDLGTDAVWTPSTDVYSFSGNFHFHHDKAIALGSAGSFEQHLIQTSRDPEAAQAWPWTDYNLYLAAERPK